MFAQLLAVTEFWSAIVGAVAGASASAVPAYLLAKRTSNELKRRDDESRIALQKSVAYKCFSKLMHVTNSLLSLEKQLSAMVLNGRDTSEPISRRISAFSGLSESDFVYFDSDEIALFVSAGKIEYANELQLLARFNAAILTSLNEYKFAKGKLREFLHQTEIRDYDPKGSTRFQMKESDKHKMDMQEVDLDVLVDGIRANLNNAAKLSVKLASEFGPLMQSHFEDKSMPHLAMDKAGEESG